MFLVVHPDNNIDEITINIAIDFLIPHHSNSCYTNKVGLKLSIVVILLVLINLLVLDYLYFFKKPASPPPVPTNTPTPTPTFPLPTLIPSPTSKIVKKLSKSVSYIPIPGNSSLLSYSWANLSGTEFYFNPDDYPGLKEAYFEANFRLFNGNGTAFVRLFDATVGIEVWGSEVSTTSQNFASIISAKLTLRPGNHLYRVQAKSSTADTSVFNSGRLKIVTEK